MVWKLIGGAYFCTEEKIKGVDMHTPYILMESKGSVKERKKDIANILISGRESRTEGKYSP